MATAEEVRAELVRVRGNIEQENRRNERLRQEREEAKERQRLRREVDAAQQLLRETQLTNNGISAERHLIDQDRMGTHKPVGVGGGGPVLMSSGGPLPNEERGLHCSGKSELNCKQAVSTGTYEWKISGMSWIKDTLEQADDDFASPDRSFWVGHLGFRFLYCPWPDRGICTGPSHEDCHVTLAMRQITADDTKSAFRYKTYIMRQDGEYVQWGAQGHECMVVEEMEDMIFGPDVTSTDRPATGIFGLRHEELLQSEWVQDDTLTVKFELEVRPDTGDDVSDLHPLKPELKVPAANMPARFLSIFEEEKYADVTFNVKGESIKAHSQVLAAGSEIFGLQFFGGLRESLSKEVDIEDVEPKTFRAFLKFLYTDDLDQVKNAIKASLEVNSSGTTGSTESGSHVLTKISVLQDILAMSHKYQVLRLLSWCEKELSEQITDEEVCNVLCQAHLCEAAHLEKACLSYIKDHMGKLCSTKGFAQLSADWPEVLLKISLHTAGVSSKEAAAATAGQQERRKRKRDESDP